MGGLQVRRRTKTKARARAKKTTRIIITTALIGVVVLSTSAWIITSKAEEQAKSKIYLSTKDKTSQEVVVTKVSKPASLNNTVSTEAQIAKEKADALVIEKAKAEELIKKAEADKLKKIAADKAKKLETSKTAKIAADKAIQEEVLRIAAERADKTKQAKIAADYKTAKAASDKAEKVKIAKLAQAEVDRLAKVEADRLAKVEADRFIKVETDRVAKEAADKLAKEAADLLEKDKIEKDEIDKKQKEDLAKKEKDRLDKIEADRLAKIEADRFEASLGANQTANGALLSAYLSSATNVSSVLNRAVELHGGNPSNTCVYFSSEAMRRIGVPVPLATCNTKQYLSYLRANGWVSTYDIKKLTLGSICFTTGDWAGYPTHTFVFMGWVNSGNYTLAYIADNQGNDVHIRNMGATQKTDAYAYFMHN